MTVFKKQKLHFIDLPYNDLFCEGFDAERVIIDPFRGQFEALVKRVFPQCVGLHIYGASNSGRVAYRFLREIKDLNLKGFVDLSSRYEEILGLPVLHPSQVTWSDALLVAVSPSNYLSVMRTLEGFLAEGVEVLFLWEKEFFDPRNFHELYSRPLPTGDDTPKGISSPRQSDEQVKSILSHSGSDLRGVVFFEGQKTFRLILEQDQSFYQELFSAPEKITSLIECGLIESELVPGKVEGQLVVEHKSLVPQGSQYWSPEMFFEAGRFFIKFWQSVIEQGYSLKDAHLENVMFDGPLPRFVDLCSIGPKEATSRTTHLLNEFEECWVTPCLLLRYGLVSEFHTLISQHLRVSRDALRLLDLHEDLAALENVIQEARTFVKEGSISKYLSHLLSWTQTVECRGSSIGWNAANYSKPLRVDSKPTHTKERILFELFEQESPRSLLDLGCNQGRYTVHAALRGSQVVALDSADSLVDELFCFAREHNLSVLPLVTDLSQPLRFTQPDFQAEVTIALAIIHHLVFTAQMTIKKFCDYLYNVTSKIAVVEFIAPVQSEPFVFERYSEDRKSCYSLQLLKEELDRGWRSLTEIPVSESRILVVAREKRESLYTGRT